MKKIVFLMICILLTATACVPAPPRQQNNVCAIFRQYPEWYWATQDTQREWGVPISVQMAIIHQESHFNGTAKPPREKILWIIPWNRPTSAYGYSQALDGTWKLYEKDRGGVHFRHSFDSACDFLGWYANQAYRRANISRSNAYDQYLAYHEGVTGYMQKTYQQKPWLLKVAKKVEKQASIYHYQLLHCQRDLPKKSWWG